MMEEKGFIALGARINLDENRLADYSQNILRKDYDKLIMDLRSSS
jgi:hypothetical protein